MKKILLLLLISVITSVSAQDESYQVAAIGFYNLENLFDTDSSMYVVNVDKFKAANPDYVKSTSYNEDEYYAAAFNSQYENLKIQKSKLDLLRFPKYPTSGLLFEKLNLKEYNKIHDTSYSKEEFEALIEEDDALFSKQEYRDLIENIDSITFNTNEIYFKSRDIDNTPTGERQYTDEVYQDKLEKLATVIAEIGTKYTPDGAALIGLSEIENKQVVEDLLKTSALKNSNFAVEEYDCMYSRGVDVGLMYNPKYFDIIESHTITLDYYNDPKKQEKRYYTRDILWVKGNFLGEELHVFINHWPSRRGGEAKSSHGRELGAETCMNIIDSLMKINPNTQVIVMGDLNDDPINKSVTSYLGAKSKNPEDVKAGELFNPLYKDYKKGYGSLGYRGSWNLFDQIIVSSSFVDATENKWKMHDAEILYNQDWINRFGGYEGGPNRSFGGNNYQGGFSDHLPSVVYLKRIPKNDRDNDGIADEEDDCPDVAGIKAFNGCPDTDEDGIQDSEDDCPEEAGLGSLVGCPDTDEDGIADHKDECPEVKGLKENNGCPEKDTDGDGVIDKEDRCPQTKGLKDNFGCPQLKEEVKEAVKAVFENLVFDTGKSTIKKSSDDELEQLAKILKDNPELLLTISGHTDNVGNDDANMQLSKDRAYAVKDRLVSLGIDQFRMEVYYYGETQPVVSNDTAEGRQANRRVEFAIRSK